MRSEKSSLSWTDPTDARPNAEVVRRLELGPELFTGEG